MAGIPEIWMAVEIDEESKKKLDSAIDRFRAASDEMRKATEELDHAGRALQFSAKSVPKPDSTD